MNKMPISSVMNFECSNVAKTSTAMSNIEHRHSTRKRVFDHCGFAIGKGWAKAPGWASISSKR